MKFNEASQLAVSEGLERTFTSMDGKSCFTVNKDGVGRYKVEDIMLENMDAQFVVNKVSAEDYVRIEEERLREFEESVNKEVAKHVSSGDETKVNLHELIDVLQSKWGVKHSPIREYEGESDSLEHLYTVQMYSRGTTLCEVIYEKGLFETAIQNSIHLEDEEVLEDISKELKRFIGNHFKDEVMFVRAEVVDDLVGIINSAVM